METHGHRPIILVSGRHDRTRQVVVDELTRRYGADYVVVEGAGPDEALTRLEAAKEAGDTVALVMAAFNDEDPDAVDLLARVRRIEPAAKRAISPGRGRPSRLWGRGTSTSMSSAPSSTATRSSTAP